MQMKRDSLVAALTLCSEALAAKDIIPILSSFCFTGRQVFAYDDAVALILPLETPINGGVHGRTLLDYLANSSAEMVEIKQATDKNQPVIHFAVSGGGIKLPLADSSGFMLKEPDFAAFQPVTIDEAFGKLLTSAMVSCGYDSAHLWRLGVTLHLEGDKKIAMYSGDNRTGTAVFGEFFYPDTLADKAVVLPPRLCDLIIKACSKVKPNELRIGDGWVSISFENGMKLLGRTVMETNVEAFKGVFDSTLNAFSTFEPIGFPPGMEQAIERSLVVLRGAEDLFSTFTIKEGSLRMFTVGTRAESQDTLLAKGHPDAEVTINPELLKTTREGCKTFAVDGTKMLLLGDGLVRIIMAFKRPVAKPA